MPKQNAAPTVVLALRVPPEMASQLRAQAEAEDRSLNGQIVHLLRFALARYAPPADSR